MRYVILMTLSGSALFIGSWCCERVFGKVLTQSMKYRGMIITLLVYAIPWIWLKGVYGRILGLFWHAETVANVKGLINIADIKTNEEAYRTREYRLMMLFMTVWFLVAISLVLIKSIRFFRKRHELQMLAIECYDKNMEKVIKRLQKEIHCWLKPKVVWTRVDNETFTLGGIRPIIFLQKEYTEEELYLILKHEMVHIARLDMLTKLIQEFVCCFHWFNPLVHILMHKMEFICETSCDERVLRGSTETEREAYTFLLYKNMYGNKAKTTFGNGLKGNDEEIEKRIDLIQKIRKVKFCEKVGVVSTFVLLVFVDSLSAFAYPKIRHVKDAAVEYAEDLVDGGNFWLYDYAEEGYDISTGIILYDEQFASETGQIYPAKPDNMKESCEKHEIEFGYCQNHIKQDDNSCVVEIYEGTRCSKCGIVWEGDFYLRTKHNICIH